jgi:hypothetical protein
VTDIKTPVPPVFTTTYREQGYAHTRLAGTYTGDATAKDVEQQFYHSYFGGRDAWAKDGQWSCVVHTD